MSWVTLIIGQQCFGLVKREMVSWERLGFCFFCLLLPVSLERTPQTRPEGFPDHLTNWCTIHLIVQLFSCMSLDSSLHLFVSHVDHPVSLFSPFFFLSLDPFLFVASSVSDVFTPFLYSKGFCSQLWSPSQTWGAPYNVLQNQRVWYDMLSQIPGKRELTFLSGTRSVNTGVGVWWSWTYVKWYSPHAEGRRCTTTYKVSTFYVCTLSQ